MAKQFFAQAVGALARRRRRAGMDISGLQY
jgi:hypothetical protein